MCKEAQICSPAFDHCLVYIRVEVVQFNILPTHFFDVNNIGVLGFCGLGINSTSDGLFSPLSFDVDIPPVSVIISFTDIQLIVCIVVVPASWYV